MDAAKRAPRGLQLKVLVMVGALVSGSVVYFLMSTRASTHNLESLRQASNQVFPALQAADSNIFLIERVRETLNAAVAAREVDELANADGLANNIRDGFKRILDHDEDSVEQATQMLDLFNKYYSHARGLSEKLVSQKVALGSPDVLADLQTMKSNSDGFTKALKDFRAQRNWTFTQSIEIAAGRTARALTFGYVMMALSALVLAIIIHRLKRDVIRPIQTLSQASEELSAGHFPTLPQARSRDEVGTLFTAFGAMIGSIKTSRENLEEIVTQGRKISGASSVAELTSAIDRAFKALAHVDLITEVWFANKCFLDAELPSGFYRAKNDGAADLSSRAADVKTTDARRVTVVDPKTHETLAYIVVRAKNTANDVKVTEAVPTLEPLAINIANALAAIRLEKAFALIETKSRKIRTIFGAISQGICTVDDNGCIGPEYSGHLEKILGRGNLAGADFIEACLDPTTLGADAKVAVQSLLLASVGSDRLNFDLNVHVLPRELTRGEGEQAVHLEVDWIPICTPDDQIVDLMVTFRDVTEIRRLRAAAEARSQETAMVEQLLQVEPSAFAAFAANAAKLFSANAPLVRKLASLTAEQGKALKRDVHTLKGNARGFGLKMLAERIHDAEQFIFDGEAASNAFDAAEALFQKYVHINDTTLRRGGATIQPGQLDEAKALLEKFVARGAVPQAAARDLLSVLQGSSTVAFEQVVTAAHAGLKQLCQQLQQPLPVLAMRDSGCRVAADMRQPLFGALTHLMRNSIDHGLKGEEDPKISVHTAAGSKPGHWQVIYSDSGRGLNLEKLRAIGVKQGVLTAKSSSHEVAGMIFHSGVSTAEKVTSVSGRGVGMDAVRATLEEHGGGIEVRLTGTPSKDGYQKFELVLDVVEASGHTRKLKAS